MSLPRSISVLMPTYQGEAFLERVLGALAAQELEIAWDFRVVDSGSTDGTLAILERWARDFPVPFTIERIHPLQFDHGDTRNLLAAESSGELLVFLTQDAIPKGSDWLERLAANFRDAKVGAAYCRNVPRDDADLLTRVFSENDPGYGPGRREVRLPGAAQYAALDPHAKRLLYNFNDVASAVRRSIWVRHPFPRTEFGEDVLMARAVLEAGFTVVYDDAAVVEHSHDYDAAEMRARARIDGKFNAEWLDRTCVASAADAETLTARQLARDRAALESSGLRGAELARELEQARELRRAAFMGLYEGGVTRVRRTKSALLDRAALHVLYVVHGFPPDTWAGTEVYTQNLALEVARLGHKVTILCRTPCSKSVAEGGPEDFTVTHDTYQGLSVWRMVHRIAHTKLRDSFEHPRAEAVFQDVLDRERPDLVHFQHLLHFSARLIPIARERGLPTVITCNDYWALCARVQLIRPDGVRCEENQGLGCLVCVKDVGGAERDYTRIPRARRLYPKLAPIVKVARKMVELPQAAKLTGNLAKRRDDWRRRITGFEDMRERQPLVVGAYAAADLAIGPSRFLRQKMLDTGLFDPHRFIYSDYGMRTDHVRLLEKRRGRAARGGEIRFGFVGSLVWYKGVDVLVRAMQHLAGRPAVLNVYGDFQPGADAHHAELQRLAQAGNVRFLGRFANDKLSEVYADIDVLVVPSVWFENSPITIHEAFLFHTPVVASDIGGMAELVRDGVDGLHFKVGDDKDLARVLTRFIDEHDLVDRLSHDWMRIKTIAEDAREMEFRYRGLVAARRGASGAG